MKLLYQDFVEETLTDEGYLKEIKFNVPEHFNFGFDVVDAIAKVKTGNRGPHGDVPLEPVVITKAEVVEE